eukprot:scaffold5287_cov59-Attheya_sp.AAC.4
MARRQIWFVPVVLWAVSLQQLVMVAVGDSSSNVVVSITQDNWSDVTKDKSVFIKIRNDVNNIISVVLVSNRCDHCKKVAPMWEKLAGEWAGNGAVLIGEVDCTVEKSLCKKFKVEGLPTLLYGDPSNDGIYLEYFGGDRNWKNLKSFAKEKLSKKPCSPGNMSGCDDATRSKYEKLMKLSTSDLITEIESKEAEIKQAETIHEKGLADMKKHYDQISLEKEIAVAKVREMIRLLKAVKESLVEKEK